jgi:hypothetical protein
MWMTAGAMVATLVLSTPAAADDPKAPPASTDDRPFTRLLPNLVQDIVALPSRQTMLLMLTGTAGAAATSLSDRSASDWALRTGVSEVSRVGATAGEGWVQGTVALGTYLTGRFSGSRAVTHLGTDLVRAQVLNGLITTGLKFSVDRARPSGGSFSFPSGHTSASFATAAVLHGHYGWKASVPAMGLATFIGWTRVRDRAHWPSDIVSGATVGAIVGLTVTRDHRVRGWTITPTPTAGGVAVYIVKSK